MDNLWKLRKHFKLKDGSDIGLQPVRKNDPGLRANAKKRSPAWIQAKDLLFAHMLTTASHERLFRNRHIGMTLRKIGAAANADSLFADLEINARRTWLALYFSGAGYTLQTLKYILSKQKKRGASFDLNEILTSDLKGLKPAARVILARATALRALAMEQHAL